MDFTGSTNVPKKNWTSGLEHKFLLQTTRDDLLDWKPFVSVSIAWLVVAELLSWWIGSLSQQMSGAFWILGIWAFSMLNLFALARLFGAIFQGNLQEDPKKKATYSVQAFGWGSFKLGCLGLFTFGLRVSLKGNSIPFSLLLGAATLVVVPLFGGLIWSQRNLRHA